MARRLPAAAKAFRRKATSAGSTATRGGASAQTAAAAAEAESEFHHDRHRSVAAAGVVSVN